MRTETVDKALIKEMDAMVEYSFKPDWSVKDLELRFVLEDQQQSLF